MNVGDPSPCATLLDWQMRWIREESRYRALGTARHQDPEFETFTYGDYLWKPAKINLARMKVGDWIFFNETLIVGGAKQRFTIAAFQIIERVEYAQLAEQDLLEDPRYAGNAHVHRNRLVPESDTRFALWRGGPGSRLLAEPLLMDRAFIEELGLLDQAGKPWDWEQHDRNGRAFNELQLIGFHTRATRLLDPIQTAHMLEMLSDRPTRAEVSA
ncbi:MAG TPA: hypothetical protein VGK54_07655 [Chloroflexota bacterium]